MLPSASTITDSYSFRTRGRFPTQYLVLIACLDPRATCSAAPRADSISEIHYWKKCPITLILYMSTSVDPTSWCTYPKTSLIKMNPWTSRNRPHFYVRNWPLCGISAEVRCHIYNFETGSYINCTSVCLTTCCPFTVHHQIKNTKFINLTKIILPLCLTSPTNAVR
jgi:hypothetical protein